MSNRVLSIKESYQALIKTLDKFKHAFYVRFGDIDLFFMTGRNYKDGGKLTKAYGNNKSVWNVEFGKELKKSFLVKHPKFMKAISGDWPIEPGMTRRVFGPFGYKRTFDKMATEIAGKEKKYYHPWLFQYMSVFQPAEFEFFLDKYIRYKRKMFIGSTNQDAVERLIGKVDYYIETPAHNSYEKIDTWYPKIEKLLLQEKEKNQEIPVIILNTGQGSRAIAHRIFYHKNIGGHWLDFGSTFHAVAGIFDRWWIKEKGEEVYNRYKKKKFEHYVFTRVNIGKPNDQKYLKERLETLKKYTFPSIKSQGNQNFKWILLFDQFTPKTAYAEFLDYPNTIILKTGLPYSKWQEAFRDWVYNNVDYSKLDFLITSRIDSDDVFSPDFIDYIQKCIFQNSCLVDTLGYQFDEATGKYYTADKYHDNYSSPFCSLIEKIEKGQKPKTVVWDDHPRMKNHFPLMKMQKRLWIQVCHAGNLTNKINGKEVAIGVNMLNIHNDFDFVSSFYKVRAENSYFRNRVNYLSEAYTLIKHLEPSSVLEIGPDAFQIFPDSDTLDINPKLDNITYVQDITKPWVLNKKYDLIVALQVWEHLDGKQAFAFNELKAHCKRAIISFPYLWENSDFIHSNIDENTIAAWTNGTKPADFRIVKDINKRMICYFEFGENTIIESSDDDVFDSSDEQTESNNFETANNPNCLKEITRLINPKKIFPKGLQNIVIPLGLGTKWGDNLELKHMLRSLHKNTGSFKLYIYGTKAPAWLNKEAKNLEFIEVPKGPSIHYENYIDVMAKLQMAANNPKLEPGFWWMYDDQYLLKDLCLGSWPLAYFFSEFVDLDDKTKWSDTLNESLKLLREKYAISNPHIYETHLPRYFHSRTLREILKENPIDKIPYSPSTLFFNLFFEAIKNFPNADPRILTSVSAFKPGVKCAFYAKKRKTMSLEDWKKQYDTSAFINSKLNACRWLNHNNTGLTKNLKTAIRNRFQIKSPFEK